MSDPIDTEQVSGTREASAEGPPGGRLPGPSDSSGSTPPPPVRSRAASGKEIPWRYVGLGVLLVYGILFVVLNSRQVAVSFVFFKPRVSLIVALVLALLIGFLAGYLFDNMRERQRRDRSRR